MFAQLTMSLQCCVLGPVENPFTIVLTLNKLMLRVKVAIIVGLVWKFIEASFEDITIIKLRITYTKSSLSYLLAFYGIPIFNTLEHFLWHAHALGHNGYIKVACVYCLRLFVVIYFSTKVQTLGALETCAAPLIGLFLLVYTRGLFPAR